MSQRFTAALVLIFAGAALRLVSVGGFNFAPIGAIALFGGLMFRNRWLAFGTPLLATLLADVALAIQNNNDFGTYLLNPMMLFVYSSWALYVLCGIGVRRFWGERPSNTRRYMTAIGGSLIGSILFFVVSNLGVWATQPYYAKTLSGLSECFVAAVPFFRNTPLSDLAYFSVIVTVMALVSRTVTDSREASALAMVD